MKKISAPIKAVIWDMDGTIFDTERIVLESWDEVCRADGYGDARSVILSCIGRNIRESNDILKQNFGDRFDVPVMRERQKIVMQRRINEFGLPIKEGIPDALAWVMEKELPMALASSSDHEKILSHLEHSDLKKYFRVIVGGDQVTKGKPDPEIFLRAAQQLRILPENCVVFEDSGNGVLAASRAGMRVVMIPDLVAVTDEVLTHIDHLLRSGTEIIPLFSEIFRSHPDTSHTRRKTRGRRWGFSQAAPE